MLRYETFDRAPALRAAGWHRVAATRAVGYNAHKMDRRSRYAAVLAPLVAFLGAAAWARYTSARQPTLDRSLVEAARAGDLAEVRTALRAGANPNAVEIRWTPVRHAASTRLRDIVHWLWQRESVVDWEETALTGAVRSGNPAVASELLCNGADPNLRTPYPFGGQTPLLLAVRAGRAGMASLLLDHGANVNEPGWD